MNIIEYISLYYFFFLQVSANICHNSNLGRVWRCIWQWWSPKKPEGSKKKFECRKRKTFFHILTLIFSKASSFIWIKTDNFEMTKESCKFFPFKVYPISGGSLGVVFCSPEFARWKTPLYCVIQHASKYLYLGLNSGLKYQGLPPHAGSPQTHQGLLHYWQKQGQ